jgi:hypothetical protein
LGLRLLSIAADPTRAYTPAASAGPVEVVAYYALVLEVDGQEFQVPCGVHRSGSGDSGQLSAGLEVSRELFLVLMDRSAGKADGPQPWFRRLGREVMAAHRGGAAQLPLDVE